MNWHPHDTYGGRACPHFVAEEPIYHRWDLDPLKCRGYLEGKMLVTASEKIKGFNSYMFIIHYPHACILS